jgi:hypothetical protein
MILFPSEAGSFACEWSGGIESCRVPQVRGRSLAANLGSLADALHHLKLSFTKPLHSETGFVGSFWHKRDYDRKVRDERELVEKLRYLHRNPVKRGLG